MPKSKKTQEAAARIAHVDFFVDKERTFVKYVKYLSSPMHIVWRNFLVGTFHGIGFIFGSALLATLMGFFVTKILGTIPFFADFAEAVNIWLKATLEATK